jgi:hypothetical protein
MKPRVLCLAIGLVLLGSAPIQAEPMLTPAQVVLQWLQWYPQDLTQAAPLTTTSLRKGLEWVENNEPLLKDLQLKYLDGKVLEENTQGVNASVLVQVRLFLVIGEVRQVETYSLKKVKGHWRIDSQEIQEDRVIGRTI